MEKGRGRMKVERNLRSERYNDNNYSDVCTKIDNYMKSLSPFNIPATLVYEYIKIHLHPSAKIKAQVDNYLLSNYTRTTQGYGYNDTEKKIKPYFFSFVIDLFVI